MPGPPPPSRNAWKTLVDWFTWSLDSLALPTTEPELEALAIQIAGAMGGTLRRFHTLEHLFRFSPDDALETLAVLYHDVAYPSVDGGWPPAFHQALSSAAPGGPAAPLALEAPLAHYRDVLAVFGLVPGATPSAGINELFSALALASTLGERLGRENTLAIAACIEATIPFRGPTARTTLRLRLVDLGFSGALADLAVQRAAHLSHQDLGDFRLEDPGLFLGGTWNLLPELNPELRITSGFSIQAYRKALAAMARFFAFLKPELLFEAWGAEPEPAVLAQWLHRADVNLTIARDYLAAKLLASALLEAFALATGPDVPLSLLMGAATDRTEDRLEARLPALEGEPEVEPVYFLLAWGRSTQTSFDLTNSPLAAWIHRQLTPDQRAQFRQRAEELFTGQLPAADYLALWPSAITGPLARALADQVPTRRRALLALLSS